jgi:hypothetical protein
MFCSKGGADDVASDAPETVNSYFDHWSTFQH